MRKEYWAYIGIALSIIILLVTCDGCGDNEDASMSDDNPYSWVQGEWVDHTQYGTIRLTINGDHIREDFGDNDVYEGSYSIYDDAIHTYTGTNSFYPLDMSARKITDGGGGYFRKQ